MASNVTMSMNVLHMNFKPDELPGCHRGNPDVGGNSCRLSLRRRCFLHEYRCHASLLQKKINLLTTASVAEALVVKKTTFQDSVKATLKDGKVSAQAVLNFVAAERNVPV